MGPRSNSDGRPNVYLFTRMARHKYIQKVFTFIEFVIIFLIIAFLVATTIPGFSCSSVNARRRPRL